MVRDSNVRAYFEHQAAIERNFYELWKNMSLGGSGAGSVTEQNLAVWDYPLGDKSVTLHALSCNDSTSVRREREEGGGGKEEEIQSD